MNFLIQTIDGRKEMKNTNQSVAAGSALGPEFAAAFSNSDGGGSGNMGGCFWAFVAFLILTLVFLLFIGFLISLNI